MEQGHDSGRKTMITWMIVIIIALPVLGLLVSSIITYTMPKIYMSTAKVELVPSGVDVEAWGVDQYMATEMEVMRSAENLRLVSQKIQLEERWGMYEKDVVDQLSRMITVIRVDNSRVIEVSCRHRMQEDAQAVCNAVYEAYSDRKADLYFNGLKGDLIAIKNEDQVVGNKLEELTLELSHVTGTYKGGGEWIGKKRDALVVQREYDAVREKKAELEAELNAAQRKALMADQSMIVHEIPEISNFPVSPNIPLNQAMGLIVGIVAASVIDGILLVCLLTGKNKAACRGR